MLTTRIQQVVSRYLEQVRTAMEFTPSEWKAYHKQHPGANKADHTIKKPGGSGPANGDDISGDADKASSRSKDTDKHYQDMKALKRQVDDANPSAKKKFDKAFAKLYENGEAAVKMAEKLVNKFDDAEGEVADAVRLLHTAINGWKRTKIDHLSVKPFAQHQMEQAAQTWGYAKKLDDHIGMLSRALKGG